MYSMRQSLVELLNDRNSFNEYIHLGLGLTIDCSFLECLSTKYLDREDELNAPTVVHRVILEVNGLVCIISSCSELSSPSVANWGSSVSTIAVDDGFRSCLKGLESENEYLYPGMHRRLHGPLANIIIVDTK
jgi:hypothetical protein